CLPPNITSHLQPIDAGIIQSFKAKYKRKFCRYLIHQFDRGIDQEKNKLNVKEAIDQIAKSWNNVTEITIQNCWKKTGILPSNINEDDMDNITNDVDQESDFEEEIEYLLNLLEIDDICDYLQEFDSSIPTEDILTDEQIINLVHFEENEDDSDTSDEKIPIVLTQQAVNSLQTFIKYFEQHDDSAQYNTNDLRTFQKYLHLTKVKETNSRR
ncbi:20362_t:CDS:2, partial [Rhizophagus irregularis]